MSCVGIVPPGRFLGMETQLIPHYTPLQKKHSEKKHSEKKHSDEEVVMRK
jgi:hypothetical protein